MVRCWLASFTVADHPLDSGLSLWGLVKRAGWHSSFPVDVSQVDHPNGYGFPCSIITPANDGMRPCIHFFNININIIILDIFYTAL